MRLFSEKVMPRLQAYEIDGGVGTARSRTSVGSTISGNRVTW